MTATDPALPRARAADGSQGAARRPADAEPGQGEGDRHPRARRRRGPHGVPVPVAACPCPAELAVELHTSATSTEWLLTATLLTGAIAVPVLGRLGDLYGKKRMLVVSLVTFLAAR